MRTYPLVLFSSTATNQNLASSAQKIDYTIAYAVQANYDPGVRGTLSLNASIDGVHFAQIQNSSVLISSSGTGTYLWNVLSANYDYMQFQFASSGGSLGGIQVWFYSKGF